MDTVPCFILAGGLGTRLHELSGDQPKPMMEIGGRPFLEFLVVQLRNQGFRHLIFCTGYRSEVLEAYFENGWRWNVSIRYSREHQALGTGGALKLATNLTSAPHVVVLNGDSIMQADIPALVRFHAERRAQATMALAHIDDAMRFGRVSIDRSNRVTSFVEKGIEGAGMINGGVYVINRSLLEILPEGKVSLEQDIFPRIDGLYALPFRGFFTDMGIPADYLRLVNQPEWLGPCLSAPQQLQLESLC
jgi:D-glycero-alpha-D-manno-heptose 1-phosphate guanylyltransferase